MTVSSQYNFFSSHASCYLCYLYKDDPQYIGGYANYDISFNDDGTKMYILAGEARTTIYQFSLSTAWNIRTAIYSTAFGTQSQEIYPHGMFFKSDGTKLYVVGSNNDIIYQYSLTTAWNVGTANYDSKSLYVGDEETTPTSLFFKADGSKVFVVGQENKTVYAFSLLTNWDISTANYDSESYSISTEETYPHSLFFSSDGLCMYTQGIGNNKIHKYLLSAAWTLPDPWNEETVTLIDSYLLTKDDAHGIYIKPDWTKIYTVGVGNVNVYYFNEPGIPDETINLKENLIAVWEMDETSGTIAYDAHGSNNLTIASGVDLNQSGILGTSFYYSDYSTDYLNRNSFYSLSGSTSFSVSIWVKPPQNERNYCFSIRSGIDITPGFFIIVEPSSTDPNYPPVAAFNDGVNDLRCNADNPINNSNWHLMVVTYDASTETMRFYIDNDLKDTQTAGTSIGNTGSNLFIGNGSNYSTHRYKGWIDQTAFWEKVLNADEISILYNAGNGKFYSQW